LAALSGTWVAHRICFPFALPFFILARVGSVVSFSPMAVAGGGIDTVTPSVLHSNFLLKKSFKTIKTQKLPSIKE